MKSLGFFVMDMEPEGFAGRRFIVVETKSDTPGMTLGPVADGPFTTRRAAEQRRDELEVSHPFGTPLRRADRRQVPQPTDDEE